MLIFKSCYSIKGFGDVFLNNEFGNKLNYLSNSTAGLYGSTPKFSITNSNSSIS